MKNVFCLCLFLVTTGMLASCSKSKVSPQDADSAQGLEGTWRLTDRQCFCPSGQVPNQLVKFSATSFAFFNNNALVSSGTYIQVDSASFCSRKNKFKTPALQFVYTTGPGSILQNPSFSLTGNTLVLDYGIACDAPRETYVRVP